MKRFLISFFKFSLLSMVFYFLMIISWGEVSPIKKNLRYRLKPDGHTFSRLKEVRSNGNIDLLFLGSSHTYRGFDTRVFNKYGYQSFNLGSNSQTPLQTEYLLNKYLDSLNPKIVVFEVCPYVLALDGVESSMEIISNEPISSELISLSLNQNHLKVYNVLLYSFFRRVFKNDLETSEPIHNNNDTYIPGGFVEIDLIHYKKLDFPKKTWEKNVKQFEALHRIIEKLHNRNIKLLLVQAPVTKDLYDSYLNNSEFDREMELLGNYKNFNESLKLNDSLHFFDFHHLNRLGIDIFNARIVEELSQIKD